jgi:hypothetical protein
MKKILVIILVMAASGVMAQYSPTFDTVRFKDSRGKIYHVDTYADDSVQVNGVMLRSGSYTATTNYWQPDGSGYITPNPNTLVLKMPYLPKWNSLAATSIDAPVWFRHSDHTIRSSQVYAYPIGIDEDTISGISIDGPVRMYEYTTPGVNVVVYVDSIAHITNEFTVKNMGLGSEIELKSLDATIPFNTTVTTVTLAYGEWVTITPATTKFITNGNDAMGDSVNYYTKAGADTTFIKVGTDSTFRYVAYSSGQNNVEVLATAATVTVTLANTNEFTFAIPAGVRVLSAKIRVDGMSSVVVFADTDDMDNSSMANRWMPLTQAWREDTGQQLMGVNARMDLSDFKKFTINGLISTTKCQIRLGF